MRISDWSSDVCSSDRPAMIRRLPAAVQEQDAGAKIAAEQQFVCAVLRALAADLTERLGESRRVRCHAWLDDWMVFPRRTVGIDLADRYLDRKSTRLNSRH